MNYPRVNLIYKNERRHQGAVSRKFLYISIVVTPLLLGAILFGVQMIQYSSIRADLEMKKELWDDLEPRLKLFKQEESGLASNQQMLKMLDAWHESAISPSKILVEVQERIPENIQLTRLAVQSEITKAAYIDPAALKLKYTFAVQGVSHGDRAERAVIALLKDLSRADTISQLFSTIDLASMRKRVTSEGETIQAFNLETSK